MIQIQNARETGDPQADAFRQAGFEQELCREAPRHMPAGPRDRARAAQYVASKFTAAVLPPLMTMATRSPGAAL